MKKRKAAPTPASCPCGSLRTLADCCGRHHTGTPAPDAEALMRSRYSAFVLGNADYLLNTWHESTRPEVIDFDAQGKPRWLGLEIRRHELTGPDTAIIEFIARYKVGGRARRLHETSRFKRESDCWFYVDGEFHDG